MDKVSSVLSTVLRRRGLKHHADASLAIHHADAWIHLHARGLAGMVEAKTLKDGILSVHCSNAVALQEMQGLLQKLQQHLQKEGVALAGIHLKRGSK